MIEALNLLVRLPDDCTYEDSAGMCLNLLFWSIVLIHFALKKTILDLRVGERHWFTRNT